MEQINSPIEMIAKISINLLFAAMVAASFMSCNSNRAIKPKESIDSLATSEKEAKLKWFEEARYGLFIHWGLYSIPAGEWKGRNRPRGMDSMFCQHPWKGL